MTKVRSVLLAGTAALTLTLVACGPTLDEESFAQLQIGMTQLQVEGILDGPGDMLSTRHENSSGGMLATFAPGESPTITYIWKNSSGSREVTVDFRDGKAVGLAKAGF
ncbi:MAG: hypothetical protein ACKVU4_06270 [Phycisphaerales bacterium]